MASKGQKFIKYDSEIKSIVAKERYELGLSANAISRKHNIPVGTVKTWFNKMRKYNGDIVTDHRKGHSGRKNDSNADYKEKYEILKKFQSFINARRKKK